MNKKSRTTGGVTLIELIIVLAVIAIIAGILIPNFLTTTDKARLKSDVQSARVIGNALALYNAEQSKAMAPSDIPGIITELDAKGYLVKENAAIQTEGAAWFFMAATGEVGVDISACSDAIRRNTFHQLNEQEQRLIRGQIGP
jgi:prepilin-type N-terminal cleavage/methylation domain-containing protein